MDRGSASRLGSFGEKTAGTDSKAFELLYFVVLHCTSSSSIMDPPSGGSDRSRDEWTLHGPCMGLDECKSRGIIVRIKREFFSLPWNFNQEK